MNDMAYAYSEIITHTHVLELAIEVLGSIQEAVIRVEESAISLGGDKPVMVAKTEEVVLMAKIPFGQTEHGVFA